MAKFKVGDVVRLLDGLTTDYTIEALLQDKECYTLSWLDYAGHRQSCGMWLAGASIAPPVAPVIDLTKPLQFKSGAPCTLIGKTSDGRIVVEYGPQCVATLASEAIINVPPPPLWPCKRWFVTWQEKETAKVSGQVMSQKLAEELAARKIAKGETNVVVNEVIFNGKA